MLVPAVRLPTGASVISRIDGVAAGIRPAGPARKTVAAAGGVGGLLVGFGFVFLFASPSGAPVAIGVAAPKRNTVNTVANGCHATRSANEGFGMFRGLSLQEAVQASDVADNPRSVPKKWPII